MEWSRIQMGAGGCRLDGLVNVIGEGGPRREGLKIGPRIRPWIRFASRTMGTRGTELCYSVIRKREVWEAGLHCASLRRDASLPSGTQVEVADSDCDSEFENRSPIRSVT